jgi:O-antigen ligase
LTGFAIGRGHRPPRRRARWATLGPGQIRTPAIIIAVACVAAVAIGALAGLAPTDAIAFVVLLAFIPIVMLRFTFGVGIFIVSTFVGLSGAAQKGLGFLVVIVAVGWLAMDREGGTNFFSEHKRLSALILTFLAWCVLGMTWATNTSDVISSLGRYIPNFLLFLVIYVAARDRRDILALAAFFVAGSAIAAGSAVLTPPSSAAYAGVARAGGTFGDPNYLAAVLVTGFALAVALSRARSITVPGQALALVVAGLCLVGILLTVSRGGLIALSVAMLAAVCFAGRWRKKILFGIVVVVLVGVAYFAILAPADTRSRLNSTGGGGSGRTTIWRVGWREVQHNPIVGVGAGNFSDAGAKYVLKPGTINHSAAVDTAYFIDTPTIAHNTYLEVLAEGGIIGAALYFGIVLTSLGCAYRAARGFRERGDEECELISYAVLCGLLGFMAASFFLSEEYSKQLYLLLAMGPALLKVARQVPVASRSPAAALVKPLAAVPPV